MAWVGLIAFSILGLCVQGADTLWAWVLIVVALVAIGVRFHKNNSSADERCNDEDELQSVQEQVIEIPDDAHDAVEVFAKLVARTYAILDQAYTRDKYFYQACIKLEFGDDDASSHAEFTFDFDWNMERFYEKFGYRLGSGLSADGDSVCYKSDHVRNLYSWLGAASIEQKLNGGKFDIHMAMVLCDGIVSTFVNNCPSAYVEYKSSQESGFFVLFKFR